MNFIIIGLSRGSIGFLSLLFSTLLFAQPQADTTHLPNVTTLKEVIAYADINHFEYYKIDTVKEYVIVYGSQFMNGHTNESMPISYHCYFSKNGIRVRTLVKMGNTQLMHQVGF